MFLYTQLFQLPFTPFNLDGDSLIPVSNAMRILDGEVMYRDFFHITPPGTELWYAALFSIFGIRLWVLNFTVLVLNLAIVWFAWYFSRQFFNGATAYLAPVLLLIFGFRILYVDGSYRLFSVIFALAAIAALIRNREPRNLVLAGVFCGLASFFGQPRGVMAIAGIGLFLVWEHFRRRSPGRGLIASGLYLGVPFAATIIVTNSYFAWSAGFDNYYFSLVTFLQKYYPSDPLSNSAALFSEIPDIRRYFEIYSPASAVLRFIRVSAPAIFFYLLIPLVYLAFFGYRWLRGSYRDNDLQDRQLMLLSMVGLALSAGVSAPSVLRLSHVAVPGIVIFVWFISRQRGGDRVAAALLGILTAVGVAYIVQRQTVDKFYLDMPAGRGAFVSDIIYKKYKWIGENTQPGDVFYEGHQPTYYFAFHLKNPTPMYVIRDNDYSPRFHVDSVLSSLERNPPKLIAWPSKWSKPEQARPPGDHLENLTRFLHANYELSVVFEGPLDYTPYSEGDVEIWRGKQ